MATTKQGGTFEPETRVAASLRMARESSAASLATLKQVSSSASFARLSGGCEESQVLQQGMLAFRSFLSSELFVPPMTVEEDVT
jgi:hypothetical protein